MVAWGSNILEFQQLGTWRNAIRWTTKPPGIEPYNLLNIFMGENDQNIEYLEKHALFFVETSQQCWPQWQKDPSSFSKLSTWLVPNF